MAGATAFDGVVPVKTKREVGAMAEVKVLEPVVKELDRQVMEGLNLDGYRIEVFEPREKEMMFIDNYVFDVTDRTICRCITYVFLQIREELERIGYVKCIVPLPYEVFHMIDRFRLLYPFHVKGANLDYVDVFVDLSVIPVASVSYKEGIHLLVEAILRTLPPIE
jgi:hypothetical protein